MKYKTYILLMCMVLVGAHGQRMRYKDILKQLKDRQIDATYPHLRQFARTDTSMISANAMIGYYLYEKTLKLDPLLQTKIMLEYCDTTALYLTRALKSINEKEIKKNADHYFVWSKDYKDTTKYIENKDSILRRVRVDLQRKLDMVTLRKRKVSEIKQAFDMAGQKYYRAQNVYKRYCEAYKSEKELEFMGNEEIVKSLDQIKLDYDSFEIHHARYRKLIKEYPIPPYNQVIRDNSIETYRLDGLTESDFMKDKVEVWNFGLWSTRIKKTIKTEVLPAKSGLVALYQELEGECSKILENKEVGKFRSFEINKQHKTSVHKFDYPSILVMWVEYMKMKYDFLVLTQDQLRGMDSLSAGKVEPKVLYYQKMIERLTAMDTALSKLKVLPLAKETPKYPNLVLKHFTDTRGFENRLELEKSFISNFKSNFEVDYKQICFGFVGKYWDTTQYLFASAMRIPLFKTKTFGVGANTLDLAESITSKVYTCGHIQTPQGSHVAYVSKSLPNRQLLWIKTFAGIPEYKPLLKMETATQLIALEEGCIALISSRVGSEWKHTALKYDPSGSVVWTRRLPVTGMVRKLIYDEVTEQLLGISRGEEWIENCELDEEYRIWSIDAGGVLKWSITGRLKGSVKDFVRVFEGYLVVFNYSQATWGDQAYSARGNGGTEVFIGKLEGNGVFGKVHELSTSMPQWCVGVLKASNDNINILLTNRNACTDNKPSVVGFSQQRLRIINSSLQLIR